MKGINWERGIIAQVPVPFLPHQQSIWFSIPPLPSPCQLNLAHFLLVRLLVHSVIVLLGLLLSTIHQPKFAQTIVDW
jgi:hypothetical protein